MVSRDRLLFLIALDYERRTHEGMPQAPRTIPPPRLCQQNVPSAHLPGAHKKREPEIRLPFF